MCEGFNQVDQWMTSGCLGRGVGFKRVILMMEARGSIGTGMRRMTYSTCTLERWSLDAVGGRGTMSVLYIRIIDGGVTAAKWLLFFTNSLLGLVGRILHYLF